MEPPSCQNLMIVSLYDTSINDQYKTSWVLILPIIIRPIYDGHIIIVNTLWLIINVTIFHRNIFISLAIPANVTYEYYPLTLSSSKDLSCQNRFAARPLRPSRSWHSRWPRSGRRRNARCRTDRWPLVHREMVVLSLGKRWGILDVLGSS